MAGQVIGMVRCNRHRTATWQCDICHVAVEMNRRTLHERGECQLLPRCMHCEVFG